MNATDLGETELEETTSSNLKTSRWALMLSESPIDLPYLRVYMLVNRRSCWRRSFINWLLRLGRESASPHSLSLQITRSTRSRACNLWYLSLFKFFSSSEGLRGPARVSASGTWSSNVQVPLAPTLASRRFLCLPHTVCIATTFFW